MGEAMPFLLDHWQTGFTAFPLMLDNEPSNADPHPPDPVTMQNVGPSANQPEIVGDEYGFGGSQAYADVAAGGAGGYGYRVLPIPLQIQGSRIPMPTSTTVKHIYTTFHMPTPQLDPRKHRHP
jgi:hypothetical protein